MSFKDCFNKTNTTVDPKDLDKMEQKVKAFVETRLIGAKYIRCMRSFSHTRFEIEIPNDKATVYQGKMIEKYINNLLDIKNNGTTAKTEGKNLVIEVPNAGSENETYCFYDSIEALDKKDDKTILSPYFCIGERVDGNHEFVSLSNSHMLISGVTGGGKSVALHNIILSLLYTYSKEEADVYLLDIKKTELTGYDKINGVTTFGDKKSIHKFFISAVDMMNKRNVMLQKAHRRSIDSYNKTAKEKLPHLFIVVEEADSLLDEKNGDKYETKEINSLLKAIAKEGRACGIHLIIASQKPSGQNLGTDIRSQLGVRIALKMGNRIESRMIMYEKEGAEKLKGNGDAYVCLGSGIPEDRVQIAMITDEELIAAQEWLRDHR